MPGRRGDGRPRPDGRRGAGGAIGRDRTSVVSLVLLALAGVEPVAIAEDCQRSGPALAPLFARVGRLDEQQHVDALLVERGTTARDVLTGALDGFDAEAYLLGAGVDTQDVAELRRRLVG